LQQYVQCQLAQSVEGVDVGSIGSLEDRVHRHFGALDHGLEQFGLTFEVVIDRAAGHAGDIGHLRERSVTDPALLEHPLGRVEQLLAGCQCFLFSPPRHRYPDPLQYI
jgi:hypothetical protein